MRRFLTISVVLPTVTCLLAVWLLADVVGDARRAWSERRQAEQISIVVAVVNDLSTAAINLRLERGAVNFALAAEGPAGAETHEMIATLRADSGKGLTAALSKLATESSSVATARLDEVDRALKAFSALAPGYDFVSTIGYIDDDRMALNYARTNRFDDFSKDEQKTVEAIEEHIQRVPLVSGQP